MSLPAAVPSLRDEPVVAVGSVSFLVQAGI